MDLSPISISSMTAGALLAERFELETMVGAGGMGTVWRALDRVRGEAIALKLTRDPASHGHEVRALTRMDHPAIARYLAHGVIEERVHYLALEWLDGEDLGKRLLREPLGVADSLAIAGGVAAALTAVHASGFVHCDLKPANIFLLGGQIAQVKLTDFGIARRMSGEDEGQSGVFGTPYYMAPEQAFGSQMLDARTDLYALGCVLFECLTGRPPFVAANPLAALTKAIFEAAPLPSEIRPGIPRAVDALVADLLAKEPWKRPGSAAEVAEEVRVLIASGGESGTRVLPSTLTRTERRLVSVVLAAEAHLQGGPVSADDPASLGPQSTLSVLPRYVPPLLALQELAQRHGAELRVLGDGSLAAVLPGSGTPTDMAANAARYALSLRALVPEGDVVVVTGFQVFTGMQPLGEVIDRASALLQEGTSRASGQVLLDAMTAALLDDRFTVTGEDQALTLSGEHELVEQVHKLLGKPTTCVGRSNELAALEALFDHATSQSAAGAVLVIAGPGVGKSRLRKELVQRIRARAGVEVWTAHGDPTRQRAPFGMLGQAVRRAARLLDGEPLDRRRQKLAARVARHVSPPLQRRVTEFLGEMVATPFPAEDSVQLRAARQEPMLMGDQMRRAWVDFLEAECRAHPVLLVLEDLHWGDRPTVDFVDTALRLLGDQPLLVLAVARPEVSQAFPGLWAERSPALLLLGELPQSACEQLVRETLGTEAADDQVARIIERSAHNAFFLEELVRAVAEQRGDDLPDTVLAMMQSRLESLEPEARRILRAGSVFGRRFWPRAVASLLGLAPEGAKLDGQLAELEQQEWLTRHLQPTFRGEIEYGFRHGLVREAAYGMLTDEDRALGHRLAGAWLEQAGERNAMVLAEHFDRGGQPGRAALWYRAAAQQALEGNDLNAAIGRVDRAIACGIPDAALGELCLIRAEAHRWQGNFGEAVKWAQRALDTFARGSESWFTALREALASLIDAQDRDRLVAIADLLDELWSGPANASGAQAMAMAWMAVRFFTFSLHARAETFHHRLREVEERLSAEPAVHACIAMERALREGLYTLDMSAFIEMLQLALERFERTGDVRSASHMRVNLGHAYNELGAYRKNVELLSALLTDSQRLGLGHVEAVARSHLGKALLALGDVAAARGEAALAIGAFAAQGDERMEGVTRAYLAIVLEQLGKGDQAEVEARRAVALLEPLPTLQPFAWAVLANVLRRRGNVPAALEASAEHAIAMADQAEEGEVLIRLVHAEVLDASGAREAARNVISIARERLRTQAGKVVNLTWRRSFLEDVPENARTMALAKAWLDSD